MILSYSPQGKHPASLPAATTGKEKRSLPCIADVISFLQQAIEPAAGGWLKPVAGFARRIPAFSGTILEVHVDKREDNIDFAARINADFDEGMMAGVKWQEYEIPFIPPLVAQLFEREGSSFAHGIENIWMEYDAPFNDQPAVFFDINRNKAFDPQAVYTCLRQVAGASSYHLSASLLPFLERVQRAGLYVIYYGLMFSRGAQALRLTINGVTPENLADALHSLGWKGKYRSLEKIQCMYASKDQKLVVGVDFGNCLGSRIGIELANNNELAFIETLHSNGYINMEHVALLKAWKQRFILPAGLGQALTELHRRPVSDLFTRFNHVKFVLDETGTVKLKLYLYFCF